MNVHMFVKAGLAESFLSTLESLHTFPYPYSTQFTSSCAKFKSGGTYWEGRCQSGGPDEVAASRPLTSGVTCIRTGWCPVQIKGS